MFLGEKLEALKNVKIFKAKVENEKDNNSKFLRSNKGGEFTSREFDEFCENH